MEQILERAQALPEALMAVQVSVPQLAADLSPGREARELVVAQAVVEVELVMGAETRLKVGTRKELVMCLVLVEAEIVKFQEVALH